MGRTQVYEESRQCPFADREAKELNLKGLLLLNKAVLCNSAIWKWTTMLQYWQNHLLIFKVPYGGKIIPSFIKPNPCNRKEESYLQALELAE